MGIGAIKKRKASWLADHEALQESLSDVVNLALAGFRCQGGAA